MQTTYPDTSAGVNEQEEPKPNYYAIIPASVRYCKELQPAAKLLFGELVALTTIKGYCYARDPYFMALYGVDRSTVQRWLVSLSQRGFIQVEFDRVANERRIYVLAMQQPGLPQKRDNPGAKMPQARRKNATQSITENNTKNNTSTLNVVGEQSPSGKQGPKEGEEVTPPASVQSPETAPSASLNSWKVGALAEVVAATGDAKSSKRFKQLLDIADNAGASVCWQNALDALEQRRRACTGPVERPGAYFCSVLVSALNARGVAVPVGSPSARRSVKSAIAASFAAAGEVQEGRA